MNIEYRFLNIITEQFAIIEHVYREGIVSNIKATIGYNVSDNAPAIKTAIKLEIFQEEKIFLICEIACIFGIKDNSWVTIYDNTAKQIKLPKKFAGQLATLTMDTARGILHAKTEGLPVHTAVILPLTSFKHIVKEDVIIDL
ncbi:hypothetical protein [Chitinophaga sp. sic0106]|uniref:hypothetical protein n=1 Tax=Chitinophaga sp. sic0106 TaxID=2854785 RepID=UPI001C493F97|nr:hypothetical protein [Chitinophaga sp. sic0106]MBV7532159.1 hypothetical protein [Chitinophaga sp. sic0106]